MLVLSRKANESVTIGDEIKITILSIDPDRVKLGIEAPKDMRVYRYETVKKVQGENRAAANVNVNLVDLANIKEKVHIKQDSQESKPEEPQDR